MMRRYYNVPQRRPGYHGHGVPVGYGQDPLQPGLNTIAAVADCLARGGNWDATTQSCSVPATAAPPPGAGPPPPPGGVAVPGEALLCGPGQPPCPSGYQCAPSPWLETLGFPAGSGACLPAGGGTPPGPTTTTGGPPPSVPPTPTPQPTNGKPPGMPDEKKAMFGLPPAAVYIGLGALGLLALAAVMKRRKR